MEEKPEIDFEKVPGTWAYILKEHWDGFSDGLWVAFNKASQKLHCEPVPYLKWREYMLWDMQRRHDEEVNGKK